MAELANIVAEPALSKGVDKLYEVLNYIWDYQTYIETLRAGSKILEARLSDVQREVNDARSSRRDIKQQVDKWLDESNSEIKTVEALLDSIHPPSSCWKFKCQCNCKLRYNVAKRANSHSKQIKSLMERCSFIGGVSFEPKPPPLAPTLASGYKPIPSREKCLERLKEALLDQDKLVVGLHGAKGVGKTMLIKKLAVEIESSGEFNAVIVTGGGGEMEETELGLSYMQDEISERIGFLLKVKTLPERERRLNDKLMSMGKIVIILDNVEKMIDLSKIGIPWPDDDNGCRILVVSRSLDLCEEMRTQVNFVVEPLSQEEAQSLFDEFAKDYSSADDKNVQQLRLRIESKSAWLPGGIETLIRSFHHKSLLLTDSKVETDGNGRARKTFMLGAEALEITHLEKPQYWRWLSPSTPTSSLKVAECIVVWWLHIAGTVREEWLSPATNYVAYFVYQRTPRFRGFDIAPVQLIVGNATRSCYLDPSKEGGVRRREDEWLEIEMGTFFNVGNSGAVVDLLVNNYRGTKSGLLVQGFEMRPLDY